MRNAVSSGIRLAARGMLAFLLAGAVPPARGAADAAPARGAIDAPPVRSEIDVPPARGAAEGTPSPQQAAGDPAPDNACVRLYAGDAVVEGALASPALVASGPLRQFTSLRLLGLRVLPQDEVWALVGGKPKEPLSRDQALSAVAQIAGSGLFSAATATLEGDVLVLSLVEQPLIATVHEAGLSETAPGDLLERLFVAPSPRQTSEHPASGPRRLWHSRRHRRHHRDGHEQEEDLSARCPVSLPAPEWVARIEHGALRPGLAWRGLPAALTRVREWLVDEGYPLATLSAALSPSGELSLDVDEGHLGGLELPGLTEVMAARVRDEIGLKPGDIFSTAALQDGLARAAGRFPFLARAHRFSSGREAPDLLSETAPDGTTRYRFVAATSDALAGEGRPAHRHQKKNGRRLRFDDGDDEADWDWEDWDSKFDDWNWSWENLSGERRALSHTDYDVNGRTVVLHLRAQRTALEGNFAELIRHTPVTGFAPGLALTGRIFDPNGRVHLALDGAFNVNASRKSRTALPGSDFLERLSAQERVDWLLGARLQMPGLSIAELGAQLYTLTDSEDRSRIDRFDSYLYSALINRPDSEYFRRSGASAFVTFHLLDQLTAGAEYRFDRYGVLAPPFKVWTLFNRDELPQPTAPVSEGEMGSTIFRLEFSSEKVPLHRVGSRSRSPTTALSPGDPDDFFRSVNSVEIGNPALGGSFRFVHFIGDERITLQTSARSQLSLRLRAGGGHDLPLEKQEALGGWGTLRGYDFKEFRGDTSVLLSAELRGANFGAFLDAGSVHSAPAPDAAPGSGGWLDPRLGVGAQIFLGNAQLIAAWRLDGNARLAPEVRLLFGWAL